MKTFLYQDFHYLDERHWWFVGRRQIVCSLIRKYSSPQPLRILDAGCGVGYTSQTLQGFGEVFAFDAAPEAVAYAAARGLAVRQGELTAIPYPDEDFDLVTALDVLEHVNDDRQALTELRRVLKKDGKLLFTAPAFQFLWSPHDEVNQHKRRYTTKEIGEKVERAGFRLLKLSYYNTALFLPIAVVRAFRRLFPSSAEEHRSDFSLPWGGVNAALTTILMAEGRVLPYINLPFGVSLVGVAQKLG